MSNLFKTEDFLIVRKDTCQEVDRGNTVGDNTHSSRNFKINYNQPSSFSSPYVTPPGNNVNVDVPTSEINGKVIPSEPFTYDVVEHLKHILALLHIFYFL